MTAQFAEVIGDPIAQSKSPLIHKYWLERCGLAGDYRATRVAPEDLASFLAARREDGNWRGCNVTIPNKEKVLPLLDRIDPGAAAIGAVNCVVPTPEGLSGWNTDIDGVAAALAATPLSGRKVALIGAGGAARAAIRYLLEAEATVSILVRDPKKAAHFAGDRVEILPLERCAEGFEAAAAIVNASPMGMTGAAAMPPRLLQGVAAHAEGKTLFDMVYKPLETPFLAAGRANGARCVDGLVMLIAQARTAFRLFFGEDAPADEATLRGLLAT